MGFITALTPACREYLTLHGYCEVKNIMIDNKPAWVFANNTNEPFCFDNNPQWKSECVVSKRLPLSFE